MSSGHPHILHIIHGLTIGGAEIDLANKATYLTERYGYKLTVCCLMRRGRLSSRLASAGIRVLGPLMHHRYDVTAARALRRLLLRDEWSLVHTHLFAANLVGTLVAATAGGNVSPIVASEHAMAQRWSRLTLLIDRWIQSRVALMLLPSEEAARSYVTRGLKPEKLAVIYNGIDVRRFESSFDRQQSRNSLRQALGLPSDSYVLGTVARLEPVKGFSTLLRALSDLTVHLAIVGEGPARKFIQTEVKRRGLTQRVHLLGARANIPQFLAGIDLFVLPSYSESFGIAVAEALLMEIPVVATSVGGIPEITGNGRFANLVPPRDPLALREAIVATTAHEAEARAKAQLGGAFVRRTMSLERVAKQQDSLYRKIL